jgi:6,7-dimethyl-8-ribityllumazine synthase
MPTMIEGGGAAAGLRFAIVRSRFNEDVTKRLLDGALDALRKGGARDEAIDVVLVPGAFEIPLVASRLARSRRYDAIICLGAVIRGETPHFEYISAEVSRGIARVSFDYSLPVIFGVLTTETEEQANARSGAREGARLGAPGAGGCNRGVNRGYEAAVSAIEMANLMKRIATLPKPMRRGGGTSTRLPSRKRSR